jgi:hypothetical protein
VRRGNDLVAATAIAALSLLLVPAVWTVTLFVTPGTAVGRMATSSSSLGSLGYALKTAAIVDFIVWFGTIWGGREMWIHFRERQARGSVGHWPNLLNSGVLVGAMLLAVPSSYYVVIVAQLLLKHGLPDWTPMVVGAYALSFAACFSLIFGLYALAVRYWPRSAGREPMT